MKAPAVKPPSAPYSRRASYSGKLSHSLLPPAEEARLHPPPVDTVVLAVPRTASSVGPVPSSAPLSSEASLPSRGQSRAASRTSGDNVKDVMKVRVCVVFRAVCVCVCVHAS